MIQNITFSLNIPSHLQKQLKTTSKKNAKFPEEKCDGNIVEGSVS